MIGREPEQIPFFLHVPDDCAAGPATIVNGEERITAPCDRSGGNLVIEFPIYATGIEASFESGDRLAGTWYRELPTGRQELMVFEARAIDEPDPRTRFPAEPAEPAEQPGVSITGIWRMEFNLYGIAKGVFDQHSSGVVTASVEVPSEYGDMRFLAGNVIGDLVLLSTFDGQNAFYLEGDVADGDATMEGVWIFSTYWDEFVAERVEDFDIIDPLSRVRYTTNDQRFDLPALRDPKYAGKAVIVQIFATWCPNCGDHAPVLAELYRVHNAEGLEILGLAFEQTDDNAYSARRVQAFRERHGVDWDIVVAADPERGGDFGAAETHRRGDLPPGSGPGRNFPVHAGGLGAHLSDPQGRGRGAGWGVLARYGGAPEPRARNRHGGGGDGKALHLHPALQLSTCR